MRITPIQNYYGRNFRYGNYADNIKNDRKNSVPSFAQAVEKGSELLPIYYYNNVLYPNENRVYSSRNKDMLERPANFLVNQYENVPCPACGKLMLTRGQFDEFREKIDNSSSDEYIDIISEYKPYMRPVELSVLEEIKDLSERENIKDVRSLIVLLRNTKLPQLQKIQKMKLKKMKRLAKTLPEEEKKTLLGKLAKLDVYIKKTNQEAPFRRKIMIDRISKIKIANKHKYKKLQDIAKSFPTSSDTNSAWIVKYSGNNKQGEPWSSHDIALRFLEFSVPNTDHIISRDEEPHHDDILNYMPMHTACNCQKSNKSFIRWFFENKDERTEYLDAYFKRVEELISTGELTDERYKDYVANATKLVSTLTKGQYKYCPEK